MRSGQTEISSSTAVSGARGLRDFGDGFAAVLLPVYLSALGMGAGEIGLVATLALLGSAMFTLAVGWLGARIGDRRTLLAASLMMMATGIAYAVTSDHFVILLIAFFGTLNPSSGSASLF